jgi:argininosuccinate synthase
VALDRQPGKGPRTPRNIELTYRKGDVVAIDGVEMTPATVLATLNKVGGKHGMAVSTWWKTAMSA